jgi:predicted SnoaL-like aldol condensation-catalyzing enzyme
VPTLPDRLRFGLEYDKVVEHWDVLQPWPEESANPHPMI